MIKKNKKNIKYNLTFQTEKAFVILVAVVVSTLLVSIGAFIANMAYKEIKLSTSARDSLKAFYAADSAIECALFHDLKFNISGGPFPRNESDISDPNIAKTISCNGITTLKIYHSGNHDEWQDKTGMSDIQSGDNFAISYFEVPFNRTVQGESEDTYPYARVRIEKRDIGGPGDKTIIQAYGHNKKSGVGIVERGIEVIY